MPRAIKWDTERRKLQIERLSTNRTVVIAQIQTQFGVGVRNEFNFYYDICSWSGFWMLQLRDKLRNGNNFLLQSASHQLFVPVQNRIQPLESVIYFRLLLSTRYIQLFNYSRETRLAVTAGQNYARNIGARQSF